MLSISCSLHFPLPSPQCSPYPSNSSDSVLFNFTSIVCLIIDPNIFGSSLLILILIHILLSHPILFPPFFSVCSLLQLLFFSYLYILRFMSLLHITPTLQTYHFVSLFLRFLVIGIQNNFLFLLNTFIAIAFLFLISFVHLMSPVTLITKYL